MKTLAIVSLLAWMSLPAAAGTFNVSPIRVGLSPQQATMPLSITNDGDEAVVIQAQAMQWSQENGQDVYVPTDHILATPPIVTIPAHGKQTLRIGMRKKINPERELSYRIYLAEVPGAAKEDGIGVQMLLRIGIPIFITGTVATKPDLNWSLITSAPNAGKLKVTNTGNAHAQLADIRLLDIGSGQAIARRSAPAYLLPGTTQEWPLEMAPGKTIGSAAIRLKAFMDSGDVNADLVPQTAN